jgi:hypothetical protein
MNLKNLLQEKRDFIVKAWCDVVLSTYPEQSQAFFKKQKDSIANPVGNTISEGIRSIYDEFLKETESDEISLFLDNIIRVRAVQTFSPSQAIGFIFGLKDIIRKVIKGDVESAKLSEQLVAFDAKIDRLALRCFDIYTQCRENIFDIRVNEVRNQSARLLKLAGLVCEIEDEPGASKKTRE